MKKTFISLLWPLLLCGVSGILLPAYAQTNTNKRYACDIGFEFQYTTNKSAKDRYPIIINIKSNSPAQKAGLKLGDAIISVAGRPTSGMSEQGLSAMLIGDGIPGKSVALEVSNFGYKNALRTLYPNYFDRDWINEEMLAKAFALYSLEDASTRTIVYPFNTGGDPISQYHDVTNYCFSSSTRMAQNDDDAEIMKQIQAVMQDRNIKQITDGADLIIDYYYTLAKNPFYDDKVAAKSPKIQGLRYDPDKKSLIAINLLPIGEDKRIAPYVMTFGIRFFNGKNTDSVFWNCEAVEFLTEKMSIREYARITVPVMLHQFPFVRYPKQLRLKVSTLRFASLGIVFHNQNIGLITDIEPGSAAEKAGLKVGDRVVGINGKPIKSIEELNTSYIDFCRNTLALRDGKTNFTDSYGLKNCRYWEPKSYKKIAKMFAKTKFNTPFDYLFSFRPYIRGLYDGETYEGSTYSVIFNTDKPSHLLPQITLDLVKDNVTTQVTLTPELKDLSEASLL